VVLDLETGTVASPSAWLSPKTTTVGKFSAGAAAGGATGAGAAATVDIAASKTLRRKTGRPAVFADICASFRRAVSSIIATRLRTIP
jgi:hypothetical protein